MTGAIIRRAAFGVSQFTTSPWRFDEDLARLPQLGIEAIEIVEDKLDAERWTEQMRAVASARLTISGVQPAVRTIYPSRMMPTPTDLPVRSEQMKRTIERLGPYARGAAFMVNTGPHPSGNLAETMLTTAATLKELAPVAADHDVTLALEPLNPVSINVESMIWTIDQALEVIDRVDRPEVGLCLDLWNVWQNADVAEHIGHAAERIKTVQLGDWRDPRSFADRIALGKGAIPLDGLIAATLDAGYDGAFILELFHEDVADAPASDDIPALIHECRRWFEQSLRTERA